MKISAEEREIEGTFKLVNGRVEDDASCSRIDELTQHYLHEVGRDQSGWDVLFIDPADQRYWELTYSSSGSHGGDAPRLICISQARAREKYVGSF